MEIKLLNSSSILLKGKKETVLVNPNETILAKNPSRIVVYNKPKYEELRTIGEKVSIMGPGEYEIGGIEIDGFHGGKENTIYTLLVDGISVCVIGKLNETLSDKKMDKISGVDVLIADTDNGSGIAAKEILKLAKSWGANYVIPVGDNQVELKKFLDETDAEGLESVDGLKIDKDSLPEGMEVVLLKS